MIKLKQLLTEKTVRLSTMKDANFVPGEFVQIVGKKGMVKLDKKSVKWLAKWIRSNSGKHGMGWSFTEGKLTERINVEKFVKAIEKGKDVVVYDKKGKRYNLQGGDKKSVQVTDHWEDAGRRNIHPERTWQTLPLSKVKKIVIEGKLNEAKTLTLPNGVKAIIDFKGIKFKASKGAPVFLDRDELLKFFRGSTKYLRYA